MGTIIGEGITFDDVLLYAGLFGSDSESGGSVYLSDKVYQTEYPDDECRNGHSYGTQNGDCDVTTGRHWYYT